jgi:hypothetical protein
MIESEEDFEYTKMKWLLFDVDFDILLM